MIKSHYRLVSKTIQNDRKWHGHDKDHDNKQWFMITKMAIHDKYYDKIMIKGLSWAPEFDFLSNLVTNGSNMLNFTR